jgi:hypothetical protein
MMPNGMVASIFGNFYLCGRRYRKARTESIPESNSDPLAIFRALRIILSSFGKIPFLVTIDFNLLLYQLIE